MFWEKADLLVKNANTSYSWVSAQTDTPESTISIQRKRGTEPKISFAVKFAHLMGVSVESLVGELGPIVVPARLTEIVGDLKKLSDNDLETVHVLVLSLSSRSEKKKPDTELERLDSAI